MGLADGYDQGVHLVEQLGLGGPWIGLKCVARENHQRLVAQLSSRRRGELVARGDAAQVLVGDGNWMVESVEQNGVRGFQSYAGECEQTAAQSCGRRGGEPIE